MTINPSKDPKLFLFLKQVSGFDSVDDESKLEGKLTPLYAQDDEIVTGCSTKSADLWDGIDNPPYSYYMYYMCANIKVLNQLRRARKMSIQ